VSVIRFDIEYPDGRRESIHVDSERIVIGSAAHCEMRLASDLCAPEHAVIEVIGEMFRVEARAFEPQLLLDGRPIRRASLPPGGVLAIGGVSIRVAPGDPMLVAKTEGRAVTPLRFAIAVLTLLAVALLAIRPRTGSARQPSGVPELWGSLSKQCPVTTPAQARALAMEKRIVADGKRERHPFYLSEGVEAVGLYTTAAACFHVAGDTTLENELDTAAGQLRAEVDDSYRIRRLRLERALATGENEIAGSEVVALRALVMGKQGAYVDWLNAVARKLNVDKDVR
jgi:hypothetical protein